MAILGCLDSIEHGIVRGWSFDDATGQSSPVSIVIDGYDVGSITGNEYRRDLAEAGLGDGYCGFRFVLPKLTSLPTIVRVISTDGRFLLMLGERIVGGDFIPKSDLFSVALANGLWMSREIVVDGIVSIEGWAVAPYGMRIPAYIAHNGVRLTTVSSPPAPDVIRRRSIAIIRFIISANTMVPCPMPPEESASAAMRRSRRFSCKDAAPTNDCGRSSRITSTPLSSARNVSWIGAAAAAACSRISPLACSIV